MKRSVRYNSHRVTTKNIEVEFAHKSLYGGLCLDRITGIIKRWRKGRNAEEPGHHAHHAATYTGLGRYARGI